MMLAQSAIFLAAAVVAVPIFTRLGLGSVLGYLAAGAIIGPSGLGLAQQVEDTMHVAELGVVLLLFLIGLELQPARLWKMRGHVFGMGGAQVAGTTALLTAVAYLAGLPLAAAVVIGLGLSLSSTAFAIQLLGEKNELTTPHGRLAFSILLFQDLAAIPALALVPLLGTQAENPQTASESPLIHVAIVAGVIVGLIVVGRLLLRPLFRFVASSHSHELSSAWALLVVIGTALIMHQIGLSMALGAFLAGVLLADSEYRHEIEANIEPFKGLLLGLFFIAVGMSAELRVVIEHPAAVAGIALGLVAVKFLVLMGVGYLAKLPRGSIMSLGVAISQGGEFAFVIYGVAHDSNVLSHETVQLLVVAVTLSMGVTPLAFMARDAIFRVLAKRGGDREWDHIDEPESSVIIAGFGRYGQIVARLLRAKRIHFTALESSTSQVDFVRRFGNKIYYGDASRVELLRAAKADQAKLFILAVEDTETSLRVAKTVRQHFPELKILARARNRQHALALMELGVSVVTRELFHSSLVTARAALEEMGLPAVEAEEAVRKFEEYDEFMLKSQVAFVGDERAMIESAKKVAADLEKLFEQDAKTNR